jgi:hypothetical protein
VEQLVQLLGTPRKLHHYQNVTIAWILTERFVRLFAWWQKCFV